MLHKGLEGLEKGMEINKVSKLICIKSLEKIYV